MYVYVMCHGFIIGLKSLLCLIHLVSPYRDTVIHSTGALQYTVVVLLWSLHNFSQDFESD